MIIIVLIAFLLFICLMADPQLVGKLLAIALGVVCLLIFIAKLFPASLLFRL